MIAERETSVTAGPAVGREIVNPVALGVNEDRGSGSPLGLLLQQQLRHLGERVVGVEDVVAGVEVQLLQPLVAPPYRVDELAGRVYAYLQLVEIAVRGQDDAAALPALRRPSLDLDAIGEERAGERWKGVELGDGLMQRDRGAAGPSSR